MFGIFHNGNCYSGQGFAGVCEIRGDRRLGEGGGELWKGGDRWLVKCKPVALVVFCFFSECVCVGVSGVLCTCVW